MWCVLPSYAGGIGYRYGLVSAGERRLWKNVFIIIIIIIIIYIRDIYNLL